MYFQLHNLQLKYQELNTDHTWNLYAINECYFNKNLLNELNIDITMVQGEKEEWIELFIYKEKND